MTPLSKPKTMVAPTTGKLHFEVVRRSNEYEEDDVENEIENLLTCGASDDEEEDNGMCEGRGQALFPVYTVERAGWCSCSIPAPFGLPKKRTQESFMKE